MNAKEAIDFCDDLCVDAKLSERGYLMLYDYGPMSAIVEPPFTEEKLDQRAYDLEQLYLQYYETLDNFEYRYKDSDEGVYLTLTEDGKAFVTVLNEEGEERREFICQAHTVDGEYYLFSKDQIEEIEGQCSAAWQAELSRDYAYNMAHGLDAYGHPIDL